MRARCSINQARLEAVHLGKEVHLRRLFLVQDSSRRIVVNTSALVVQKARNQGVSIELILGEVISLIDNLDSDTLFGILKFRQGRDALLLVLLRRFGVIRRRQVTGLERKCGGNQRSRASSCWVMKED